MAELATIARPYAQALFEACSSDLAATQGWLNGLAQAIADDDLMRVVASPRVGGERVFEAIRAALGDQLPERGVNFLRTVIANRRLALLPEVARQFRALADAASSTTEGVVHSPYELTAEQLAGLQPALERHFGRKLKLRQRLDPALIGGVRVVVGDEVLDSSIRARLSQMKTALTAH